MPRTGRPNEMHKVARTRADGSTVTAAQAIVEALRAGAYIEGAAPLGGVSKQTVYAWLRHGTNAHTKASKGERLTKGEQEYRDFLDAVSRAQAESEQEDLIQHARIARGGIERQVVRIKVDETGREIERQTTTERTLPSASALEWRLERRFPDRWGRKDRVELSGPEGEPIAIEVRAARIREAAEQLDASRPELTVVSENGQVNG